MQEILETAMDSICTTRPCSHCGLPTYCDQAELRVFCCNGCMGAFALIHELGLEDFYALRSSKNTANVDSMADDGSRSAILADLQASGVEVRSMSDGSCSVRLSVEGLHCAACSWLIERIQPTIPGLLSAAVRMSDHTIELIYDPTRTQPVLISKRLSRLGYSLSPWTVDFENDQRFIQQQRDHWVGIALAAFFAANAMWIGVALYAGESTGISISHEYFLRWVGTVLAVLATALPGRLFFQTAWQAIRTRTPHVDIPVALSLLMGIVGSLVGAASGVGQIYFDSLASLILLLRVGRYIQFRAQYKTSLSLSQLLRWNAVSATLVEADGIKKTVPVSRLQIDDRIEVRPGETIPADGLVIQGVSSVDTSLLNGECLPESIAIGASVVGGTTNITAPITVTVTSAGSNSRVGRLMELVRDAASHRTPSVAAADRVSKWFVLVVLLLAVANWCGWAFFVDAVVATKNTMALLTIACPCALALAAPLVLTVALGRAAKRQIWIRDGNCLERLAKPGVLWLDKTGTLTCGRMKVVAWHGDNEGLQYAASIEKSIHHPIANAICDFAKRRRLTLSVSTEMEHQLGKGVKGSIEGVLVVIGNEEWLNKQGIAISVEWLDLQSKALAHSHSVVWIAIRGVVEGMFEIGDPIRPDAVETLHAISDRGWRMGILSGDRQEIVDSMATFLRNDGIAIDVALGQQSPEDKLSVIRRCKEDTTRTCAMVGDGVNDAPALAVADVGIALRGGSEQSLYAAPIFIANGRLSSVLELIEASVLVVRGIRRCFAASLVYNAITITLAMMGWINPLIAAVLMPLSGVTVLTMAMSTNTFSGKSPR